MVPQNNAQRVVNYSNRAVDRVEPATAQSSAMRRVLSAAAEQAAGRLVGRSDESVAVFRDEMKHLSDVVYSAAVGAAGASPLGASPTFSPDLVDLFRREFLALLDDDLPKRTTAKEIVAVLSAMESMANRNDERSAADGTATRASADALNGMLEIAHDMRSPLAAILLLVEPIRRGQKGPVTPIQERQLGLIYGAALGLSTLANDIIDAARGECPGAGERHPFSVCGTMQDACTVVRPIAEEKGLDLTQTYPKVDARLGDAAAIHRVLVNLASNALKYTERGSVSVGGTELDETRVEFWVKDTGRGIPENVLKHLFDEFRPGPVGSRFFSAGLGLTICRRLLKTMNSTLEVETALDRGTRFSFVLDLPLAPKN